MNFKNMIKQSKTLIPMIHVHALPGAPRHSKSANQIISAAVKEAELYKSFGLDTVMIENMHDIPYVMEPDPVVTGVMAIIGMEIRKLGLNCGVQILASGGEQALAVALAADLQFVRVEGFVFGHLGDEGFHEACAGSLMRYRKLIGADCISVFTDIKKKHSAHAVTADVSLEDTAHAAAFFLSDAVIVTGTSTGKPVAMKDLCELKDLDVPVIIGSGITPENLPEFYPQAHAFIVGSYLKKDGLWSNDPDPDRIRKLLKAKSVLDQGITQSSNINLSK